MILQNSSRILIINYHRVILFKASSIGRECFQCSIGLQGVSDRPMHDAIFAGGATGLVETGDQLPAPSALALPREASGLSTSFGVKRKELEGWLVRESRLVAS